MTECTCVICSGRLPAYFRKLIPDVQAVALAEVRRISGERGLQAALASEDMSCPPAPLRWLAEQLTGSPDQSVALHERFDPVSHLFV
jgi:hypothetical protein